MDTNSPAYKHGMAAAEHLHAALFELNATGDGYMDYQSPDRPYGQAIQALRTTLDHLLGAETAKRVEELAGTTGESLAWAIARDAEDQAKAPIEVEVWGPNLPRSSHGEAFHVHAKGCADIVRNIRRGHWKRDTDMGGETIEVRSFNEVVEYVYDPGDFEYDPDDTEERSAYDQDVYVFPCVEFPA